MVLAIFKDGNISIGEAFLIAIVAILIVFFVLAVIIFITFIMQKGMEKVEAKTNILPREENKILSEDENAVAAALVATMEFYRQTGKVLSVLMLS